jgi:hypothetical protein
MLAGCCLGLRRMEAYFVVAGLIVIIIDFFNQGFLSIAMAKEGRVSTGKKQGRPFSVMLRLAR